MIHTDLLESIKQTQDKGEFLYPYYGKYSIAEIAPSILNLFGVKQERATLPDTFFKDKIKDTKRVILFMVDGLGYDHLIHYKRRYPFFGRVSERADVFPITSVFPSTTPAALTTIHTGLTPQEHGLPEWTVYFEEFDKIIETFPFRPLFSPEREELLGMGGKPQMLYDGPTVYQQLRENGIHPYVFIHHEYSTSAYSRMSQAGSTVVPFSDFPDLFNKLNKILLTEKEPAYFFVYWSHIDSTCHAFGPHSQEHFAAMQSFSDYMMNDFLRHFTAEQVQDILFLMVADHGHVSIKGEDIIFLNNHLPLQSSLRRTTPENTIYPTGAPHDVFLHIYEPKLEQTLEYLKKEFAGKAEVITTHEAVKRGLFGLNGPSTRFMKRIGDILILPYRGYHVWYKHLPDFQYGQKGTHGGLTLEEMIVPFVVGKLSDLL